MSETTQTTSTVKQPTASAPAVEPEVKAMSPEEIAALHTKLRARMQISKLQVTAPVGYTPYWARKEDASELARLDYLGFRKVIEIEGKPKRYLAQGLRADGTYVMGDVMLMEIRKEEYEFYLSEQQKRSSEMAQSAKDKFIEDANKQGAPTFAVKRTS